MAYALKQIFEEGKYADKVLEALFKQNKQWGSRDRRVVAESVYDIVRNYGLFSHIAQTKNNYWFIAAVYFVLNEHELPPWPEFKHVIPQAVKKEYERCKKNFPLFYSIPDSLHQLAVEELGEITWMEQAKAMHQKALVSIRVNTLKTNKKQLSEELEKEGIAVSDLEYAPDTLVLKSRKNLFVTDLFKNGLFEMQDAGSQQIGLFANPKPGQTVIDACAGAGGKSLHLACLMKNKGRIIAMDTVSWKLEELGKRARRAGVYNIETHLLENFLIPNQFFSRADILLLDVPCSGSGVLKRNPDAKWKFNEAEFEKTKTLQAQILEKYQIMLKPGGKLIYATCSIFPSENQSQVQRFLEKNTNFTWIADKTIWPSEGFDGFYMCELKKHA